MGFIEYFKKELRTPFSEAFYHVYLLGIKLTLLGLIIWTIFGFVLTLQVGIFMTLIGIGLLIWNEKVYLDFTNTSGKDSESIE